MDLMDRELAHVRMELARSRNRTPVLLLFFTGMSVAILLASRTDITEFEYAGYSVLPRLLQSIPLLIAVYLQLISWSLWLLRYLYNPSRFGSRMHLHDDEKLALEEARPVVYRMSLEAMYRQLRLEREVAILSAGQVLAVVASVLLRWL